MASRTNVWIFASSLPSLFEAVGMTCFIKSSRQDVLVAATLGCRYLVFSLLLFLLGILCVHLNSKRDLVCFETSTDLVWYSSSQSMNSISLLKSMTSCSGCFILIPQLLLLSGLLPFRERGGEQSSTERPLLQSHRECLFLSCLLLEHLLLRCLLLEHLLLLLCFLLLRANRLRLELPLSWPVLLPLLLRLHVKLCFDFERDLLLLERTNGFLDRLQHIHVLPSVGVLAAFHPWCTTCLEQRKWPMTDTRGAVQKNVIKVDN